MPTLQDLMATIQGGQGATPGQGNLLAALAPLMGGGGGTGTGPLPGGVDSQIQQQIAALSQPEPTVDQPVPQQSKLWQRLIAGIADAGSVYAKGLNPYVPTTNSLGYLLGQDQAGKDITAQNAQNKKNAAYKGSQRGAEAKLRMLLNQRDTEIQQQSQAADNAARLQVKQAELDARAASDAAEAQAKKDEMTWKERMQSAGFRHDEALVKLRAQYEGGSKVASEQIKLLGEAKQGVNQIANNLDNLKNGWVDDKGVQHPPMSVDQIRTMFRRELAAMNLTPDAESAAQAYFDKEVESQLPFSLKQFGAPEIK